jgi:hypothetical protein
MSGLSQFPVDADLWPVVRYRFDLEGESELSYDMVVEGGKARMELSENMCVDVNLHCDRAAFVLMMFKRVNLASLSLMPHVTIQGDQALVTSFDQWLQQA